MKIEEAIAELIEDKALYETDICHAGDGTPDGDLMAALDMAIDVLNKKAICRWHKLWEDPLDLPHAAGHKVELCLEGVTQFNKFEKTYCHGFIGYGDLQWYTCDNTAMRKASCIQDNRIAECYKVIAWREIEELEEG